MQMREDPRFFMRDELTKYRTSIIRTVAVNKVETTLTISGPGIAHLEWQDFRAMWENKADPTLNFTPHRIPWSPILTASLENAGYRFAEVVPWWFNRKSKLSPPPITAGMLQLFLAAKFWRYVW
jgi:hypothetical protein